FATLYFAPTNAPLTLAQSGNQIKLTWRFTPSGVFTGDTQTPLALGLINTPDTNRLTADAAPGFGNYAGYSTFTSVYFGRLFYWLQQGSWADPTVPNVLFTGDQPGYAGWANPASAAIYSSGDTNGVPYTFTMTLTRLGASKLAVNTLIKSDTGFVVQSQYVDDHPNTFAFNTATIYAMNQVSGTFDTTRFDVQFNPVAVSDDARVVVKDTWNDGDRTDPAPPVYSEQGVDVDNDGDIESAWFNNSGGSMNATPGHLVTTITNGETYWTTYFTVTNHPVTLAKAGDRIKATWAFTPSNVHGGSTQTPLHFALLNTLSTNRLTADGALGAAAFAGYATFMGVGGDALFWNLTLGGRTDTNAVSPLFTPGYFDQFTGWTPFAANYNYAAGANGQPYTFVMTLTRNAAGGLDIESTVTGAAGVVNDVSVTDDHPNTFAFDAATIYGDGTVSGTYDTTLFQVDNFSVPAVQSVTNSGGMIQFAWNTQSNLTYQVQCTTNLAQDKWVNFGGAVAATGSTASMADDVAATVQKFYRIILLP
ncbi:MAG TPA: hypothetical protein VF988_01250, partial [Verrucomicrobiae bacterium]